MITTSAADKVTVNSLNIVPPPVIYNNTAAKIDFLSVLNQNVNCVQAKV
jgi:hypothetical protein